MVIGKVSMLPAREQVVAILRQAILLRQFEAGKNLTLKEASEMVGASITPVREAFQILENEGLVELRPNKGAVVLGVSLKNIHDHYFTRAVLESAAAKLASMPDKDTSEIAEVCRTSEIAVLTGNVNLYRDCNTNFHMSIWRAADNSRMSHILSSLWNGFSLGYMITEAEYMQKSWEEHKAIYEAISKHNGEMAENLMQEHINRSMNDVLTRYDQDRE